MNTIETYTERLQELNHRFRNYLQLISSRLSIEEKQVTSPECKKRFRKCKSQVQTMAGLHDFLNSLDQRNVVELTENLPKFIERLVNAFQAEKTIDVVMDLPEEPVCMEGQRFLPLALALNELIINSIQHGFKEVDRGSIHLELELDEDESLRIELWDDGKGMDFVEELDEVSLAQGVGLHLTESLIEQTLDGTMNLKSPETAVFGHRKLQ